MHLPAHLCVLLLISPGVFSATEPRGCGEVRQEASQQQDPVCLHQTLRGPEGAPGPEEQGQCLKVEGLRSAALESSVLLAFQAFLEMSSHEEAVDMVNYHKENPACLYGKPLSFYLSKTLLVIEVGAETFVVELSRWD